MKSFIFAVILAFTGPSPAATQASDLNTLIDRVDQTFARMKDFSADFIQISAINLNRTQQDQGHLYLTRDRKMRADYLKPEEKLFISNGKTLYSYYPLDKEVTQEKVTDTSANLTPLMALVGRAGLRNEFKQFVEVKTATPLFPGDRVIRLIPKRQNEDVASIEIEVNPGTSLIDHIVVVGTDKSRNEFIFNGIAINTNIPASKFEFTPPPGTRQVIQGSTP